MQGHVGRVGVAAALIFVAVAGGLPAGAADEWTSNHTEVSGPLPTPCESRLVPLKGQLCQSVTLDSVCAFTGVNCGWEPDFPNIPPVQQKTGGWIYIYTIPDVLTSSGNQWTVMIDLFVPVPTGHYIIPLTNSCPASEACTTALAALSEGPTLDLGQNIAVYMDGAELHIELISG